MKPSLDSNSHSSTHMDRIWCALTYLRMTWSMIYDVASTCAMPQTLVGSLFGTSFLVTFTVLCGLPTCWDDETVIRWWTVNQTTCIVYICICDLIYAYIISYIDIFIHIYKYIFCIYIYINIYIYVDMNIHGCFYHTSPFPSPSPQRNEGPQSRPGWASLHFWRLAAASFHLHLGTAAGDLNQTVIVKEIECIWSMHIYIYICVNI